MFKFKRILTIGLLAGFINPVYADIDNPEHTVELFYQHIKHWECDEAVNLAEGYSKDKCIDVSELNIGPVERVGQISTKALVKVHVVYQQLSTNKNISCDVTMPLNRKGDKWVIDFATRKFKCGYPNIKSNTDTDQQTPPPRKTLLEESQPKPPPRQLQPRQSEPWFPLSPSDQPEVGNIKSRTLLDTWRPDELQGQPGDEDIIKLRPPDRNPPQRTQPNGMLGQLDGRRYDSIRRVRLPDGKKLVALTFDLCEQADDRTGYDRNIVNILRGQQIPATFFAGGKWMRSHEDKTMQLMADPNFEIGNHAWTHGNLRVLKGQKMLDQIIWTQAEYERIWEILNRRAKSRGMEWQMEKIPRQPLTLRFPYGTCSLESLHAVNELGLSAIQWDVVSGDAAMGISAEALARNIINQAKPGSIIVFHSNGRGHGTAKALPQIIKTLRDKGFKFVTVSKMLVEGIPESVQECYELRPGDNRRYDTLFGEGTE